MRELQRERGPGHLVRDPSYAGSPHFSSMQWLLGPATQQDRRSVPGQCPESREQGRGQGSRPAFPQGWPGGWAAAQTAQVTLTLPKLSAYSRYSEDISCTEGQGVEGPCPPDATNPRTPKLAVLVPTEGQGWGRRSLPPSSGTSGIPLWPQDSPGCCDGPWSQAACGQRGLWWTPPGCACILWEKSWGWGSHPGIHLQGCTSYGHLSCPT